MVRHLKKPMQVYQWGLHKKWGYSHIGIEIYDDLQEIPDGSRDSASRKFTKQISEADTIRPIVSDAELKSYSITPLHQHVQHYRFYSANNFTLGAGRLAVNFGYQRSVRREFSHPVLSEIPGLYLQLNTYSYDIKYYFPEFSGWNLSMGVNGMYQTNDVTSGTEFIIPSYHQFDVGPFALLKKTMGKLDIAGGLRYDSRNFTNKALYTSPDPVTGFDKPVAPVRLVPINLLPITVITSLVFPEVWAPRIISMRSFLQRQIFRVVSVHQTF